MSIKLEKVNYIYGEGSGFVKHALKDVSLTIEKNEFIGLIGHTGSGKSTLTQIFNGLLKATTGRVLYDGEDIYDEDYDMRALRTKVGLVFQYPEHQLFESTVFKDVCFGPENQGLDKDECEKRASEALEMVGLDKKYYDSSPFELSGGQKRRAAIAGVLAMSPEVIILDEPTAGLDPRGRDEILDMISELHRKTENTVVLVSHSMDDVARYVDRILVMNQGSLMYDDTPKEIFFYFIELEDVGLSAPQITYIMNELADRGFPVDTTVTTLDEGFENLLSVLRRL